MAALAANRAASLSLATIRIEMLRLTQDEDDLVRPPAPDGARPPSLDGKGAPSSDGKGAPPTKTTRSMWAARRGQTGGA